MGRSQETFGKREREKKRLKKKEAKLKAKEERKANPVDKGDNITYVDVYGNFHDTPPDEQEKVDIDDIVIGIPKKEESEEEESTLRKGVVTYYNQSKGYGFIKDKESQESVFMHVNQLEEDVVENNIVTFETEKGPKGLNAINVKVVRD
jgi:cold shock CspA family protein